LERAGPVESVVFVCLGNVCRSPYAAASLQRRLAGRTVEVDSVGFMGPNRPPPEVAVDVARENGVDHSAHRSHLASLAQLDAASLVFIFDRGNLRRLRALGFYSPERTLYLGDLDPIWGGKRPIWDPWGRPREAFELTFRRIDRCLEVFLESL